jgi:hypothetical protein
MKAVKNKHKFTLGVFYRAQKPVYHNGLYGDHNPLTKRLSRSDRITKIKQILFG